MFVTFRPLPVNTFPPHRSCYQVKHPAFIPVPSSILGAAVNWRMFKLIATSHTHKHLSILSFPCFLFAGVRCETLCETGTYGADCSHSCRCENNGSCDASTGACICDRGWIGEFCEESCPDGFYGRGCIQRCPTCVNGNINQTDDVVFVNLREVFSCLERIGLVVVPWLRS